MSTFTHTQAQHTLTHEKPLDITKAELSNQSEHTTHRTESRLKCQDELLPRTCTITPGNRSPCSAIPSAHTAGHSPARQRGWIKEQLQQENWLLSKTVYQEDREKSVCSCLLCVTG